MPVAITATQLSHSIGAISAARSQRPGAPHGVSNPESSTARPTHTPGLSQNALMRAGVEYLGDLGAFGRSDGPSFNPEPGTRLANHAAVLGAALKAADALPPEAVGGRESAEYKALEAAAKKVLKHGYSGATGDFDKTVKDSGRLADSLTQAEKALQQYVAKVGTQAFSEQVFGQVILPEAMDRIQANFPALFADGRWTGEGCFDARQFLQAEHLTGTLAVMAKGLERGGGSLVTSVLEAFKLPDYVLAPAAEPDPNAGPANAGPADGGQVLPDSGMGAGVAGHDRIAGSVHHAPVTVTVTGQDSHHTCESGAMKDAIAAVDRSNERMHAIVDRLLDGYFSLRADFGGIDNVARRFDVHIEPASGNERDVDAATENDPEMDALMAKLKDLGGFATGDHQVRNGMNTGSFNGVDPGTWTSADQSTGESVAVASMTDQEDGGAVYPPPDGFKDGQSAGVGMTNHKARVHFDEVLTVIGPVTDDVEIGSLQAGDHDADNLANTRETTTRQDRVIDARIANMLPGNRPTSQERQIRKALHAELKGVLSDNPRARLKTTEANLARKDFRTVEQVNLQQRVEEMAAKWGDGVGSFDSSDEKTIVRAGPQETSGGADSDGALGTTLVKTEDDADKRAKSFATTTGLERGTDAGISNRRLTNRPTSQERQIGEALHAELKGVLSDNPHARLKATEANLARKDFRTVEQVNLQQRVEEMAAKWGDGVGSFDSSDEKTIVHAGPQETSGGTDSDGALGATLVKTEDDADKRAKSFATTTGRERGNGGIPDMSQGNRPASQEAGFPEAWDVDQKRTLSGAPLASKTGSDRTAKDLRSLEQVQLQEQAKRVPAGREHDAQIRETLAFQLNDINVGIDAETTRQRMAAIAKLEDRLTKRADVSTTNEVLLDAAKPPVRTPAAGSSVVGPQSHLSQRLSVDKASVSPGANSVRPPFGTHPTLFGSGNGRSLNVAASGNPVASTVVHRGPLQVTPAGNHEAPAPGIASLAASVAEQANRLRGGHLSGAVSARTEVGVAGTRNELELAPGQASVPSNASAVIATSGALNAPGRLSVQLTDINVGIDEDTTRQRMAAIAKLEDRLTKQAEVTTTNVGLTSGLAARNPQAMAYGSSAAERSGNKRSYGTPPANLEPVADGSFDAASASRIDTGNTLTSADSDAAFQLNHNTDSAAVTAAQAMVATTSGLAGIVGPDEKLVRLFSPIERKAEDVGPRIVDNLYRMKGSEHRILVQTGERYQEIASLVRR